MDIRFFSPIHPKIYDNSKKNLLCIFLFILNTKIAKWCHLFSDVLKIHFEPLLVACPFNETTMHQWCNSHAIIFRRQFVVVSTSLPSADPSAGHLKRMSAKDMVEKQFHDIFKMMNKSQEKQKLKLLNSDTRKRLFCFSELLVSPKNYCRTIFAVEASMPISSYYARWLNLIAKIFGITFRRAPKIREKTRADAYILREAQATYLLTRLREMGSNIRRQWNLISLSTLHCSFSVERTFVALSDTIL